MNIFWLRRDLRLNDNKALSEALKSGKTQLVFIFDSDILEKLDKDDKRVSFIYKELKNINNKLIKFNSSLKIYHGNPYEIWNKIIMDFKVENVFFNEDYEPKTLQRDNKIESFLKSNSINIYKYKDQVIFSANEVLKSDKNPYTVFTPYSKKWKELFFNQTETLLKENKCNLINLNNSNFIFPDIKQIGFKDSNIKINKFCIDDDFIKDYNLNRDFPAKEKTTNLGIYLRFGTISIREVVKKIYLINETLLNELIWREFFIQILFHFPKNEQNCFKTKYENIKWLNNLDDFNKWKNAETGYPIIDAAMNQLNKTGMMHNRLRMISASFLCKHLLIDWRFGQDYFAEKLLDFELASNNGNWQWIAGCGCDSAPYFRIFNPIIQTLKFDKQQEYIKKWLPNFNDFSYPNQIIQHETARKRCLDAYSKIF